MNTTRRALVIGSETYGLKGVIGDAERIASALEARSFAVDRRLGKEATRAGILEGYESLITKAEPEDAVVLYYSGHGAVANNPAFAAGTAAESAAPRFFQFIIPFDFPDSTPKDFRGISSYELSALLGRLSERTKNVTVLFDCCHSARMTRDLSAQARALPHPLKIGIDAFLANLAASGIDVNRVATDSNPHCVRLAAAGVSQCAYEYANESGAYVGAMTESLLLALEDAADLPVTWRAIADRVRERVLARFPHQRPEVEGPAGRLLFALDEPAPVASFPMAQRGIRTFLGAGRIHSVNPGDEYLVFPMTAGTLDTRSAIGTATVRDVAGAESEVNVALRAGVTHIPEGARAVAARSAAPRRPVALVAQGEARERMEAMIASSPVLRVRSAGAGEAPLATIRVEASAVELRDRMGLIALGPMADDASANAALLKCLHKMAVAQGLRELEGGAFPGFDRRDLTLAWGLVEGGKGIDLPPSGAVVAPGTRVFIRVGNRNPKKKIFVSVFDIGLAESITLLSASWASGIELRPGDEEILGKRRDGTLAGMKLGWPKDLPTDEPRSEEIVIIATEEPADLRSLEDPKWLATRSIGALGSLQGIAQRLHGGTRDLGAIEDEPVEASFVVARIDFAVDPRPAAITAQ